MSLEDEFIGPTQPTINIEELASDPYPKEPSDIDKLRAVLGSPKRSRIHLSPLENLYALAAGVGRVILEADVVREDALDYINKKGFLGSADDLGKSMGRFSKRKFNAIYSKTWKPS